MTRYTPLWLQAGSYPAGSDRFLMNALWPAAASSGLAVTVQPGTMTVNIAGGKIAVPVAAGGTALCISDAVEHVTLAPAPGSGMLRWDFVIAQVRGNDIDGGANNDFLFTTVTGTPASGGTEQVPTIPANAINIAAYHMVGGAAALDPAQLFDQRPAPGGLSVKPPAADTGWLAIGLASNVVPFPGLGVPYARGLGYFGYLSGVMQLTAAAPAGYLIGVLPVGVRPPVIRTLTVMTGNGDTAGRLNVNPDGTMTISEATNNFVSLDGVTFAL